MTVYYSRVMTFLYNKSRIFGHGFRHFNSLVDDFYQNYGLYKVSSVNNHALDLNKINDFAITRFIRDPRDLVVSGYFYHKRCAEPWCSIVGPKEESFKIVNGSIPKGMNRSDSFCSYLARLDKEDGLIAEIEFRRKHFVSMLEWPDLDPRIRIYKYEEMLGNEVDVFSEMFSFYGVTWPEKKLGVLFANYFSAKNQKGRTNHIRNANSMQWKEHFTPKVASYFEKNFSEVLNKYDYN